MKIFIIEDEKPLLEALRDKFTREGYEVASVEEGSAAVARATAEKPDLIILDLILPGKHGLEVLKEMKEDADLKATPVIVLSNLDTDADIKEALRLGAADYFVKAQHPIAEVVEKVKTALLKPR